MKLDLIEIQKLNPPGLLNLRPMLFVVEVMMGLIAKEMPNSQMMLKLVRALARYQKQVRDNEAYNLNVRIKFWVLAQAQRRAWVRGIIGEAAVRRWQRRYDNLNGGLDIASLDSASIEAPARPPKRLGVLGLQTRAYDWKQFVMADLNWLRVRPLDVKPATSYRQSLYTQSLYKQSLGHWRQSRTSRGFKPVEFWAIELAADYVPPDQRNIREKCGQSKSSPRTKPGHSTPDGHIPPETGARTKETASGFAKYKPP